MHILSYLGLPEKERNTLQHTRNNIIIDIICDFFKTTHECLADRSRKAEIVYHRQLVHFFFKKYTPLKEAEIGLSIQGASYDRTTVKSSCKAIQDYYDTSEAKRFEINCLDAVIRNNLNII